MRLNKVKKLYSYELEQKFKKRFKVEALDWRYRQFFDELCDSGLYVQDFPKNKPRLRLTFPLYLICILFFHLFAAIKWMFTGSYTFNEKSFPVKQMIAWDRYCRFNIV